MTEINKSLEKERPTHFKEFRQFRGCMTQNARTALPDGKLWYLENVQPIGDANIHSIDDISATLIDYTINSIYWSTYVNVNGTDYLLNFATNGNIYAFNTSSITSTLIASGLSGAGTRVAQWKNQQALFIDSTGYYHWDGTTFAIITGVGVPAAGTEIAVYSGRVWIFNGRLLVVSAADDYTAAAFLAANGAIAINLTDPTLRNTVVRAIAANGYLYFAGSSSINVISNVYVPSGASPPAPLLTNTNIQSTVGSDQPGSFFTVDDRDLFFGNSYGIYRLRGVSADRVSEEIDGTWQFRDPSIGVSGGAVLSNRIMHAAILMKRLGDPQFGNNTILCMYARDKWWFANYGSLTLVVGAISNNAPALYGFIGNKLFKLFSNTTSAPSFIISTALWPMEDPVADKQVIRAGFEVTAQNILTNFTATLDTPTTSIPFTVSASVGQIQWVNNANAVVQWVNNAAQVVQWFNGQFLLYYGAGAGGFAHYVGMTIKGQAQFELSGIFMDYKFGNRWSSGVQ